MTRYEAYTHKTWREQGPVSVFVARIRDGDRVEFGLFWVDRFCLGVRHALFDEDLGEADFRALLDDELPVESREALHPACAKKFIEGAIAYAEQFGFAPEKGYRKARRVFSGVDVSLCPETYTYGDEGRPCYIETNSDPPERTERVLAQLEARCGPDGFDCDLLDEDDGDLGPQTESLDAAREGLMEYFGTDDSGLSFYEFSGMVVGMLTSPECPSMSEFLAWTAQPERRQPRDAEETQVYFDHARHYWNNLLPAIAACHDGPLEDPDAPIDIQPEDFPDEVESEENAQMVLLLHGLWCRGFLNTTRLWPEAWGDVLTRPDLAPYWKLLTAWGELEKPGSLDLIEDFSKKVVPGERPMATALRAIIRASPRRPIYPASP